MSHFIFREFVVCIGADYMKNERVSLPEAIHVLHERITERLLLNSRSPLGLKTKIKQVNQTQVGEPFPPDRTQEHSLHYSLTHPLR